MVARFVVGAEEFLREFSARVPLYLASNTPVDDLLRTVQERGLEPYFTGVYGCPPWRKTEAVIDVSHRIGCEPAEIALIGDARGDQEAAARSGAEFVWRRSDILYDDPPERGFDDLEQIGDFLRPRLA